VEGRAAVSTRKGGDGVSILAHSSEAVWPCRNLIESSFALVSQHLVLAPLSWMYEFLIIYVPSARPVTSQPPNLIRSHSVPSRLLPRSPSMVQWRSTHIIDRDILRWTQARVVDRDRDRLELLSDELRDDERRGVKGDDGDVRLVLPAVLGWVELFDDRFPSVKDVGEGEVAKHGGDRS
jgi:hypothetical protein